MKKILWFLLGLSSILLYGCTISSAHVGTSVSPTPVSATSSPAAATQSSPIAAPPLALSPTPGSTPKGAELPRTLYLLSADHAKSFQSVWRLAPGKAEVERVTPPDLWITSFDVWLGDGRIAYGTRDGQLYVALPEQEPRLLYDASFQADDAVLINSVAWSPEGARLAYSVRYQATDNTGSLAQFDGLWLITLDNGTSIKLLSNRHLNADRSNLNDVRSVSDPLWSPDGTALILTGHYWEWIDTLWLDPVAPDPTETNLHDPPGELWTNGSWANDSQSILLSGTGYSQFSDLVQVKRDSKDLERLLEGEIEGLFIYQAQELPDGIAFLASQYDNPDQTQLYLGRQTANGFRYAPAGPDHYLCSSSYARDIAWDPTGQLAILSCSQGIQLVSLDGTVDVDLLPFLGPLVGEDYIKAFWAEK